MVRRTYRVAPINRTQVLVLAFLLLALLSLVVILAIAPEIYDVTLRLAGTDYRVARLTFLAGLSALLMVIAAGVVRRWRWMFWLLTAAFLAGVLRVPASLLQLLGVVPTSNPTWYVLLQALLGVIQLAVGLAMLRGYKRAGIWAAF